MLNLFSEVLSPDHERVLDLGLQFVPTPSPSMECDITRYWDDYLTSCRKSYEKITTGNNAPFITHQRKTSYLRKQIAKNSEPKRCPEAIEASIMHLENDLVGTTRTPFLSNPTSHLVRGKHLGTSAMIEA